MCSKIKMLWTSKLKQQEKTSGVEDDRTEKATNMKQDKKTAISLDDGQTHTVWRPEHVSSLGRDSGLLERRKRLLNRVWATQQVLRVQSDEGKGDSQQQHNTEPVKRKQWQRALKNVTIAHRRKVTMRRCSTENFPFHDIVSQYATAISTSDRDDDTKAMAKAKFDARNAMRLWKSEYIQEGSMKEQVAPRASFPVSTKTAQDSYYL